MTTHHVPLPSDLSNIRGCEHTSDLSTIRGCEHTSDYQLPEGVNTHQTYQLPEGVNTHQTYQYQRVWTHMYTKTESSVTTHQADLPFDLPIFSRYEQIPVTDAWMAQGPSLTLLQPAHQDTSQNQKQKLWHMQPCSLQCLVYVKAYSHRLLGCAQNVYAFMGVWKCLISS